MARYNWSNIGNVRVAYKNPSQDKIQADNDCFAMCKEEGGYDYRIISYNCQAFTAAWRTDEGLRVKTRYNSYIIK